MENIEKVINLLKEHGQKKILKELEKNKSEELIEQISKIDFEKIEDCKKKIGKQEEFKNSKIESISYVDSSKLTKEEKEYYEEIGRNIISNGQYAVVTMAGGQRN